MLTKGKKVIMKYDFTSILDRNGKDAIAVEHIPIPGAQVKEGFDRIPMWVADMNFPTAPTVVEAMMERVQHPAYGYFDPSEEYYASIIRWQEKRNGVTGLEPEHIGYENGVLGGVISALNVMCSKGDNVLLHSPTYIGFTMSLFVATLAFPPGITQEMAKVGIFIGSIVAGLLGSVVLILAYQIRKMRGKI